MKKHLVSLILVFFILGGVAQAQIITRPQIGFGIKAGLNFASLSSDKFTMAEDQGITALADTYTGFHIGLVSEIILPGFYLQPEFLFTRSGRDYRVDPPTDVVDAESDFLTHRFNHFVIPVIVGTKIGPLKVGVGPSFSFLLNQSIDATDESDFSPEVENYSMGYQLGVGLSIGNLLFDARYEGSLSRLGDSFTINENEFSLNTRPQQYILSVGILF